MSQTKHTPGPWKLAQPGSKVVQFPTGAKLAQAFGDDGSANAALIAAAPEMLAALEAIVTEAGPIDEAGRGTVSNIVRAARAAIARAKGEK